MEGKTGEGGERGEESRWEWRVLKAAQKSRGDLVWKVRSLCFLADIDLSSPYNQLPLVNIQTHSSVISVIDRFHCENQPASCIWSMTNHFKIERTFGRGDISNLIVQQNNGVEKAPKAFYRGGKQHLAPLIVNNNLYYEHLFDLCLALPLFFLSFCLYFWPHPCHYFSLLLCPPRIAELSPLRTFWKKISLFLGLLSFFLSRGQWKK